MPAPICWRCQGRGGFRGPDNRWHKCRCMSKLPASTRARIAQQEQMLLDLDPERKARAEAFEKEIRRGR